MKTFIGLTAIALAVAGCATVTRGTTNQIQITSEPAGAEVRTSLNHTCITPCTLTVDRKAEFSVTYALSGYQEQVIQVRSQLAGAGAAGFAGNVIAGGIVGMGVDAATGATLEHVPNPVHAILAKAPPPPRTGPARVSSARRN